jgi:hypothetical protein
MPSQKHKITFILDISKLTDGETPSGIKTFLEELNGVSAVAMEEYHDDDCEG